MKVISEHTSGCFHPCTSESKESRYVLARGLGGGSGELQSYTFFRGPKRQAWYTTLKTQLLLNSESHHLGQDPPVLAGVKPGREGLLRPGSNTGGMPWSAGYVGGRLRA